MNVQLITIERDDLERLLYEVVSSVINERLEPADKLFSRQGAADYLGVSSSTIGRMVAQGLPVVARRYKKSDLDKWK